jgi:molybdopterin-guanine dinucleotide biosynthesis protein
LRELLRQIHKKNEELKVQQEMNHNLKLATELKDQKKPLNVGEYSSVSSSKQNMERFKNEKWVDIPIHHHQ